MTRLVPIVHSFLRRRITVSYWLILLIVIVQIFLYFRARPVNLASLAYVRLGSLQATFRSKGGEESVRNDWGLQLGTIDLTSYTAELQDAWALIFGDGSYNPTGRASSSVLWKSGRYHPVPWDRIARRLALDADPRADLKTSIPHRVYTTSSLEPSRYPWQFRYWAENDASLSFRHLNDTTIDEYLNTIYPPGTIISQMLNSLPNPKTSKRARVLKADIFRYTILLHKGGIYTDIDTAAVKKIDEWGEGAFDMTDQLIAQIPRVMNGELSLSSLSQALPIPPPALIVSIEKSNDPSWRQRTMTRGLQIVQWTIAAQPGHPVFLDVLDRIVGRWLEEESKKSKESWDDGTVLEWTGPGPWSDAVLRYILARHGLDPKTLVDKGSNIKAPIRIGDVIILPERAFQADASEKDSALNNAQACVWHGFLGSWKEDPEDKEAAEDDNTGKEKKAAIGRD